MAEQARDAARTIPRSVGLTVAAVLALYLLIPIVALSALPVTQDAAGNFTTTLGTEFARDRTLAIVQRLCSGHARTEVPRFSVGTPPAVAPRIAPSAGWIGVSRLSYS